MDHPLVHEQSDHTEVIALATVTMRSSAARRPGPGEEEGASSLSVEEDTVVGMNLERLLNHLEQQQHGVAAALGDSHYSGGGPHAPAPAAAAALAAQRVRIADRLDAPRRAARPRWPAPGSSRTRGE